MHRFSLPPVAARQGDHLMGRLREIASRSPLIGDVRGIGLMACLELATDRASKAPLRRCAKEISAIARSACRRGAMVRTSGANIILSPVVTICREEIDHLCDALAGAFAEVEGF